MRPLRTERFWLDHLLAVAAGVMGVYACAMSVANQPMANIMASSVLIAGIVGYGLSLVVENTRAQNLDAWLFALFGFVGVFQSRAVNNAMPEDGFPFAILAATMMFILLVVGALFAWRDSTLLFLSLPSLVLFGLVGTIDSWRPGLFMFCGYLLAVALLYARVHQRTMIQWAEQGGADRRLLRRDVWRWMAGPEYAFAAAGTIILLSFIGAPVVQTSLTPVSENVRASVRNQVRSSFRPRSNLGSPEADVPVGDGPRNLSERIVLTVQEDQPRYLKTGAPLYYRGNGWSYNISNRTLTNVAFNRPGKILTSARSTPIQEAPSPENALELLVEIRPRQPLGSVLPSPGPVIEIDQQNPQYQETSTGDLISQTGSVDSTRRFVAIVPKTSGLITENPRRGDLTGAAIAPIRQTRLAEEALRLTEDVEGDYAKAEALRNAIATRCNYNLDTPRTPAQKDTAEYFYFESRQGYCDHFATAMTLMARSIGLPARYAVGYLVDPEMQDADGFMIVRENMAHAWTEIYFEGYGWVVFDATGGARDITQHNQESDTNLIGRIRTFFVSNARTIFGALLLAALTWVFFMLRSRSDTAQHADPRREVVLTANRLQHILENMTGRPKRFSQTHREYAEIHRDDLLPVWDVLQAVLPSLERALFGVHDPTAESLAELRAQVAEVEKNAARVRK